MIIAWGDLGNPKKAGNYKTTFGMLAVNAAQIEIWRLRPQATFYLVSQELLDPGPPYRLSVLEAPSTPRS